MPGLATGAPSQTFRRKQFRHRGLIAASDGSSIAATVQWCFRTLANNPAPVSAGAAPLQVGVSRQHSPAQSMCRCMLTQKLAATDDAQMEHACLSGASGLLNDHT